MNGADAQSIKARQHKYGPNWVNCRHRSRLLAWPIPRAGARSPDPGLLPGRSWQRFLHDAGDDRGHDFADGSSLRAGGATGAP